MKYPILIVDDDANLLKSFKRVLSPHFDVHTAESGKEGLEVFSKMDEVALIISDFNMPGMNGIEFLAEVRKLAPESVRIMLTGYADLDKAMAAVNEGNVFRFLTKPCETPILAAALKDGIKQYKLVKSEKELLEKTLTQTVEVLSEILSLVNPAAFERGGRIKRYVRFIASEMDPGNSWQYDIASLLSHIGCLMIPEDILRKLNKGKELSRDEELTLSMHPAMGADLLAKIPRLEQVAEIIRHQSKSCSEGEGDDPCGIDNPLGGRILKAVLDYDRHLLTQKIPKKAFAQLEAHAEAYDPIVLYYLEGLLGVESRYSVEKRPISKLAHGMIIHQDVLTDKGAVVIRKSFELSQHVIDKLTSYAKNNVVIEPIEVLVP